MNKKLIEWSDNNYSHLPWRENRSLYNTLVSEIMLQQTTVGTVLNHFGRFVLKYPNADSLARISEEQMLLEWKGLGYYRRARNLLGAARQIVDQFNGEIPLDYDSLISIKGIGAYTANAILGIGADEAALAVDANLERVLARIYGLKTPKGPKLQSEIQRLFMENKICTDIKIFGGRNYNEALMDLGRSICKARSAACEICPMVGKCVAQKNGKPLEFPTVLEKNKAQVQGGIPLKLLRVIVENNNNILAFKKNEKEWLTNQLEIPTYILHSEDETLKQYPTIDIPELSLLPSFKSGITKYKIENFVLHISETEFRKYFKPDSRYVWIEDRSHLSTGSMKAIYLEL